MSSPNGAVASTRPLRSYWPAPQTTVSPSPPKMQRAKHAPDHDQPGNSQDCRGRRRFCRRHGRESYPRNHRCRRLSSHRSRDDHDSFSDPRCPLVALLYHGDRVALGSPRQNRRQSRAISLSDSTLLQPWGFHPERLICGVTCKRGRVRRLSLRVRQHGSQNQLLPPDINHIPMNRTS